MAALVDETPADWGRVVVTLPPPVGGLGGGLLGGGLLGGGLDGGGPLPQGRHWLYHSLLYVQQAPDTQEVEPE